MRRALAAALLAAALASAQEEVKRAAPPPAAPRLLWIVGHGELPLDPVPGGATGTRDALQRAFPGWRFETGWLRDLRGGADAVAILAGPQRDLSEEDAAALRAALSAGARVLLCVDPLAEHPRTPLPRLRQAVRESGADIGTATIVDVENERAFSGKSPAPKPLCLFASSIRADDHPLLALLPPRTDVLFADACAVSPSARPGDLAVTVLARTSATAFARNPDGSSAPAGPLAVAVERKGGGRLVVVGDATFLTNAFAARTGLAEPAFALAAARWLAEGLAAPPPPPPPAAPAASWILPPWVALLAAVSAAAALTAGAALFRRRA